MLLEKIMNRLTKLTVNVLGKKKYKCNVCNRKIYKFEKLDDFFFQNLEKYGYIHPLFAAETINLLQYSCPFCGSSDRDRLYALFLADYFKKNDNPTDYKFLDIAPAKCFSKWIKKFDWINYRTVDLFMQNVDDKADITDMKIYADNSFDFVLCSHVLEHIEDDKKALSEIYRILKKGASAIIMAPILLTLENDFENPEYKTESERWKYFGQDDHVRMYSKSGFISKLEDSGFKVEQITIKNFSEEIFEKNGISKRSVLYVVNK